MLKYLKKFKDAFVGLSLMVVVIAIFVFTIDLGIWILSHLHTAWGGYALLLYVVTITAALVALDD